MAVAATPVTPLKRVLWDRCDLSVVVVVIDQWTQTLWLLYQVLAYFAESSVEREALTLSPLVWGKWARRIRMEAYRWHLDKGVRGKSVREWWLLCNGGEQEPRAHDFDHGATGIA